MQQATFVIAIDFGTTFSSVAWSPGGDEAALVNHWPGLDITRDAVPSVVYYNAVGQPVGWGYHNSEAEEYSESHSQTILRPGYLKAEWFKLRMSASVDNTWLPPLPASRTAESVIIDFLGLLRLHVEKEILETFPAQLWNRHLNNIQYVLTVPAIWDLAARDVMRHCMLQAGYRIYTPQQLMIISEPEAAAIHYAVGRRDTFGWQVDDNVLIIDAGGGTTDLCSYLITSKSPFQVREAVQGTGGLLGGTHVDTQFMNLAISKLRELPMEHRSHFGEIIRTLMKSWTNTWKVEFGNTTNGVPLTIDTGLSRNLSVPQCGIHAGHMQFTDQEIRGVFQPIIDGILTLVDQQLRSLNQMDQVHPKNVFPLLVGGFGQSAYLRNQLRERLPPQYRSGIGQFTDAWTAVVQGALLAALERVQGRISTVTGHVSRKNFTISTVYPAQGNENPSRLFYHPITQQLMARGVAVIVRKGQSIAPGATYEQQLFRSLRKEESRIIRTALYENTDDEPPQELDGSCRKVCEMLTDLSCIPLSEFKKIRSGGNIFGGGQSFYQIHFTLRIGVGDGNLDLDLLFQGRSYGKQRAVFV